MFTRKGESYQGKEGGRELKEDVHKERRKLTRKGKDREIKDKVG